MKPEGYIYVITNICNDKRYVGQTIVKPHIRWSQHKSAFKHFIKTGEKSQVIYLAFRKYGLESFTFEVILSVLAIEDLDNLECEFIEILSAYNNGYNMTLGGGGVRGVKVSQETRDKRAAKMRGSNHPLYGVPMSQETKDKISKAHMGKKASEETKQLMSKSRTGDKNHFFGKKHSSETLAKISESRSGIFPSEETRKKLSLATSGENNPNYGKTHSVKTRRKMSEKATGRKGTPHTQEFKDNLAARQLGVPLSEKQKDNISRARIASLGIAVVIDSIVYASSVEAAKTLGVSKSTIGNWVRTDKIEKLDKNEFPLT